MSRCQLYPSGNMDWSLSVDCFLLSEQQIVTSHVCNSYEPILRTLIALLTTSKWTKLHVNLYPLPGSTGKAISPSGETQQSGLGNNRWRELVAFEEKQRIHQVRPAEIRITAQNWLLRRVSFPFVGPDQMSEQRLSRSILATLVYHPLKTKSTTIYKLQVQQQKYLMFKLRYPYICNCVLDPTDFWLCYQPR